jgi:hypothetical protein
MVFVTEVFEGEAGQVQERKKLLINFGSWRTERRWGMELTKISMPKGEPIWVRETSQEVENMFLGVDG